MPAAACRASPAASAVVNASALSRHAYSAPRPASVVVSDYSVIVDASCSAASPLLIDRLRHARPEPAARRAQHGRPVRRAALLHGDARVRQSARKDAQRLLHVCQRRRLLVRQRRPHAAARQRHRRTRAIRKRVGQAATVEEDGVKLVERQRLRNEQAERKHRVPVRARREQRGEEGRAQLRRQVRPHDVALFRWRPRSA